MKLFKICFENCLVVIFRLTFVREVLAYQVHRAGMDHQERQAEMELMDGLEGMVQLDLLVRLAHLEYLVLLVSLVFLVLQQVVLMEVVMMNLE